MEKRLLKSSVLYIGLGFLAPAVNFFLVPIYTKNLDKADYALITLAVLVQAVLTPINNLGLNGAFSRYFFDHLNDKKAINSLFSTTLFFFVFTGCACLLVGFLFGKALFSFFFTNDVFIFSKYGYFIIMTVIAMNIQQLVLTYYRNYEKNVQYAFWSVCFFLSAAAFIYIGVAKLHMGALGSIEGRAWGTLITLVPFMIIFFTRASFTFSWQQCKEMLPYAIPLVPYLLLTVAFAQFDKALVERNFSLSQLGEYGFAGLIASVIDIIINAVQAAVYPPLFKLLSNYLEVEAIDKITGIFRITIVFTALTIAGLISFTGICLHWFIDARYWGIMRYFPLLCLVYIPRLLFIVWSVPLMYFKKTKYLPMSNGFSLVIGISIGSLLIKPMGIFAMPVALFLVQLSQVAFTYLINRRLNIHLPSFKNLSKEYNLLLVLLLSGIFCTYLYLKILPNIYIYIPLFFCICIYILILYFNFIKSKLSWLLH